MKKEERKMKKVRLSLLTSLCSLLSSFFPPPLRLCASA
jgi:hypothetical protein